MKTVLVTGANGFIGRHSLPFLTARGYRVHGTYLQHEPEHQTGISFHQVDLLNPIQTSILLKKIRPSHLLHFAWYLVPGLYWTSKINNQWLKASQHLAEEFQTCGGKRLVVAGTCAEYDWSLNTAIYDDQKTPTAPATLYGQCKKSLASFIQSLARRTDLNSAWGRIFMLYGPHEYPNRLVSSLIRGLLQGQIVPCSSGEQVRDVMYVKDVASAFVSLLDSNLCGPINIASGEPILLKDLMHQIGKTLKGESLIRLGERPMPAGEPQRLVADVHRLREELRWSPAYNLTKGLDETIAWWSSQNLIAS